eukprot:CAMPEP_0174699882 /NCGR_PEP_ID=MMETSP1094-20130205/5022_1 /TAXON_ID=156173 /ORGANISM="Chrysochromulina brevifilum, Strain UTEX LB 985" /LENGTH=39 /DNA_ID= /DNA_START= /DNA_END= /DNA_ORIENTATION=
MVSTAAVQLSMSGAHMCTCQIEEGESSAGALAVALVDGA